MALTPSFVNRVFGVLWSRRAWSETLYLLLAFPLGLAYFVMLAVGWSLGLGTLLIWIGAVVLAVMLLLTRAAVSLERGLATTLLGADLPAIAPAPNPSSGPWRRLYGHAIHPVTFKGMLFLLLKFPLGLGGFVVTVVGLSLSLALIAAPLGALFSVAVDDVTITTVRPVWAPVWSLAGVLLLVAVLHLFHGLAAVYRWLAGTLLVYRAGVVASKSAV